MPLPPDLPVVDHHCHLSPTGDGVEAARRFRAAGGTHLFLATQNYAPGVPRSVDDYRTQFEVTEGLARRVHEATGVVVYPVVAPYPIDLVRAAEHLGVPAALDLHLAALDLAGRWVTDGRAVAIGEVGRPHFAVPENVREAVHAAFRHALEVARDAGCPAIVHAEDLDGPGYRSLAALAESVALPAARVVKHYARTRVPPDQRAGVAASYLARRELITEVLPDSGPWFLETDYLDDPKRPGAVLDLATVPRRARQLVDAAPGAAERLRAPFVDSVRTVYGWTPQVTEARPP